uniref:Uncharacterized protein n=1 Tax=Steinernema glaseri TaxID=37863 RepID=A0A1I8AMI4_9BILA
MSVGYPRTKEHMYSHAVNVDYESVHMGCVSASELHPCQRFTAEKLTSVINHVDAIDTIRVSTVTLN